MLFVLHLAQGGQHALTLDVVSDHVWLLQQPEPLSQTVQKPRRELSWILRFAIGEPLATSL